MAQNIRLTDKVSNVNEEDELRKRGYIVGVTLGEGSYAKVKSAFSETHNRKVALKIINRKKAPKDFQQRFLPRELDILRRIRHPNVIQLVDIMHFNHKVLFHFSSVHSSTHPRDSDVLSIDHWCAKRYSSCFIRCV